MTRRSDRDPWETAGMSRASWYRHGKPTKKPTRFTQKEIAEILGVSLRTAQRDAARIREDKRKKNVARVREYMAQGYSQDEAYRLTAAELRAVAIEDLLVKDGGLVLFAQASQCAAKMADSGDSP
jgi:uncharacterized protein YoaH (UPF0181 family)